VVDADSVVVVSRSGAADNSRGSLGPLDNVEKLSYLVVEYLAKKNPESRRGYL
jgi:hypothetical protein